MKNHLRLAPTLGAASFVLLHTPQCSGLSHHVAPQAPNVSEPTQRRTFLSRQLPAFALGVVSSSGMLVHHHAPTCRCPTCNGNVAHAYERRDVGGADASPETKAMNLQAFETNNRLERDGLKLEVRQKNIGMSSSKMCISVSRSCVAWQRQF
jgi:hypothetical protein